MFKQSFKMPLSPTYYPFVAVIIHAKDFKMTYHVLGQENLTVVIKRRAVKSAGSFIKQSNRGKLEQTCTISFVGYMSSQELHSACNSLVVTNGFIFHLS